MKRAVAYLRVSSGARSRYGDALAYDQNPAVQEGPLRRLAEHRSWSVTQVYCDRASGAKESRPELDRMLAAARRGEFDVVMVWRFDRLSRSVQHFLRLVEELQVLGVDLVSHEQSFDTTTPMGKFCLTMFAALAELEREVIRERVRAGLEFARLHGTKSGRAIGRPRRVFDRQKVLELRQAGLSWREIARRTGQSVRVVHRAYQALPDAFYAVAKPLEVNPDEHPHEQRSSAGR
jgi:DNA invertase Pin-like site-specific DNA recombinase